MAIREKRQISFPKKLLVACFSFLFLVMLIVSFLGKKGLIEIYQKKKRKEVMQLEVNLLKLKRDELMRDIWELENNPQAVEFKAREKLWLMRTDEIVIVKD